MSILAANDGVCAEDKTFLLLARLKEGRQNDEEKCQELNTLTKLLSDGTSPDAASGEKHRPPYHQLIDGDCMEIILGYIDMRQSPTVRGHATLAISAYLKASGDVGAQQLSNFFHVKVGKDHDDDFILVFSVVAFLFPIIPDVISALFLSKDFVPHLIQSLKKKRKGEKIEQAALEMLNSACINTPCRELIRKHCREWLEELLNEAPSQSGDEFLSPVIDLIEDGPPSRRVHSERVRGLAAVVLAKLQAVPSAAVVETGERIIPACTSIEELSDKFKVMLSSISSQSNSIEGLAYASLQPRVKEKLASDVKFLQTLIKALAHSPTKSPSTYGALNILVNLTSYAPSLSEEQKRMSQLKAYATASQASKADPLNDDEHVENRCQSVFKAGVIPVLVTHSQHGSAASLMLVVSIVFSLSKTAKIRGKMAQQGAVKLSLHAFSIFAADNHPARRKTAHALARILISTNPLHVFGGSNPLSITSAIRPLVLILSDDPTVEHRDLLPVFESLLALTNLASTDDTARNPIIRLAFPQIEDLLLSNNTMITRATVELICNLMQSPEGVAKFADGSKQASQRMHILLALTDAEDYATRRAAGGAIASLTEWDTAVNAILERDRGVMLLLALCKEDEEELRHRGVVCVLNIISAPAKVGEWGLSRVKNEGGVQALKESLRKSRHQQVLEITVEALKKLLDAGEAGSDLSEAS